MNNKLALDTVMAMTCFLGCDTEQTEESAMPGVDVVVGQLPEYSVEVTQSQAGKLSEYKLCGRGLTMGTQEKIVYVSAGADVDIQTEEKTLIPPDTAIDYLVDCKDAGDL